MFLNLCNQKINSGNLPFRFSCNILCLNFITKVIPFLNLSHRLYVSMRGAETVHVSDARRATVRACVLVLNDKHTCELIRNQINPTFSSFRSGAYFKSIY